MECRRQHMLSYILVTGTPDKGVSTVFGLIPEELRFLKVCFCKAISNTSSTGLAFFWSSQAEMKTFWTQNVLENGVWLWRWSNLLCLLTCGFLFPVLISSFSMRQLFSGGVWDVPTFLWWCPDTVLLQPWNWIAYSELRSMSWGKHAN